MRITVDGLEAQPPAARPGVASALRGVGLRVEAGEQLAVIGPSGAGKTTLLHVLACALKPRAGTLRLDAADPWRLRPRALRTMRGRIFLAPQAPPLPPRQRVVTALLAARLPTMFPQREYVETGGLMSYGPNFPEMNRRAADFVDKILRGAKPADIPVEQPTKFDLIVNLITARALGLTVPQTVLARADEVIE